MNSEMAGLVMSASGAYLGGVLTEEEMGAVMYGYADADDVEGATEYLTEKFQAYNAVHWKPEMEWAE